MKRDVATRKPMSARRKKNIWEREGGICWMCEKPVPMTGRGEVVYDHRIPLEAGGTDDDENIYPLHYSPCDKIKTAQDKKTIAKAKRQAGETGQQARRKQAPLTRKPSRLQSRGFDGRFKKKMNGEVVRRDK